MFCMQISNWIQQSVPAITLIKYIAELLKFA